MSKGSVVIKLLVFIIALVFIGIVNQFLLAHKEFQIVKKGLIETEIIIGTNKMELLEKSLQQALAYSYYQSSYEVAKNGGYEQTASTWRKYDDISKFPDFKEALTKKLLSIFNLYATDLKQDDDLKRYGTIVGNYQSGKIVKEGDKLENVSVSSDTKLEISTGIYRLVNEPKIFVQIPIRVLTLFDMGKSEFVDKDSVGSAIQSAESSLPTTCKRVSTPDFCETPHYSCESFYPATCQSQFESGIKTQISALQSSNGIKKELDTKETKIAHVSSGPFGTPSGKCCVSGHNECSEVCTGEGEAKECHEECSFVCDVFGTQYVNAFCEFKNYASARVEIKITDTTNKYPVYEGNVDMRNIQLNFNVISGNDYSQKLIQ